MISRTGRCQRCHTSNQTTPWTAMRHHRNSVCSRRSATTSSSSPRATKSNGKARRSSSPWMRVVAITIPPFSRGGHITHVYGEHSSFVKFVERNWYLGKLSERSRDNLPNPRADDDNPYVPVNMPAIGDLFDMFDFGRDHDRDGDRNSR